MHADQLRQIAILVDSLDRVTADRLLEHLPAEEQRIVRNAVLALNAVTEFERADVVRKFYGRLGADQEAKAAGPGPSSATSAADGDFLPSDSPASIAAHTTSTAAPPRPLAAMSSLQPLAVALRNVPVDSLVHSLAGERPQALAVVAAALTAERAASFISHLPRDQQPDILRRVANLTEADQPAIEVLQEALFSRLAEQQQQVARQQPNLGRVRTLIGHIDRSARSRVLEKLAEADRGLVAQLREGTEEARGPAPLGDPHAVALAMDRLVDWEPADLTQLFTEIADNVAALALLGASQPCCDELLARVPADVAEYLRAAMEGLGSWRLSDVRQAQQILLATARQIKADPEHDTQAHLKLMA